MKQLIKISNPENLCKMQNS